MKEGWEYKKLGDTLFFDKRFQGLNGCKQEKIVSFSHVSAEELKNLVDENGDVRLLSTGNFSGYTTKEKAGSSLNCGEVITIPTGGTANIKYYNGLFVDSGNIIGIASNASIVLRFIYYAMIANNDTINSYYRGASIKHPYMPDIYKIPIPVPSKFEQQRIVDELDLLSSIIEKKNVQLNELDNLAHSLFYEMFGDPITNENGWEVKRWKEMFDTRLGKMLDRKKQISTDTRCPYLANINVKWGSFDLSTLNEMTFSENELREFSLQKGDILICEGGEAGRCAIWTFDNSNIKFQKAIHRARIKNNGINDVFTCYYIMLMKKNGGLKDYITKATIEHLTGVKLNTIPVLVPPLSLQQQFASKIEAIEHQKELIKQSIKEVEMLFNSRMDHYFN